MLDPVTSINETMEQTERTKSSSGSLQVSVHDADRRTVATIKETFCGIVITMTKPCICKKTHLLGGLLHSLIGKMISFDFNLLQQAESACSFPILRYFLTVHP